MKKKTTTGHDHDKQITSQKFIKLELDNFTAWLKQANVRQQNDTADFVKKTVFDNKLMSFNKRITSNKTKDKEFKTKLDDSHKKTLK